MELRNLSYLLLLLCYLIVPAGLSFGKKTRVALRLRYLLPALLFGGAIFIMWDIRFTELAIWTYNPDFLTGINILQIPIEKWLSLLIIPLTSAYIYEWGKSLLPKNQTSNILVAASLIVFVALGILSYIFRRQLFSFFTFFLTAIYLGYIVFKNRFKPYYPAFYFSFLVTLLPFFIVSAIAGNWPVMVFNSAQITGVVLAGIPVERIVYLFLMLLISLTGYEYLNKQRYY